MKKEFFMNKSKSVISALLLLIMGLVFLFLTKSLINLAFVVCAFGVLLMSFGERIISRIIMLIGALGVAYCGYQMIMFVINSVL